MRGGWQERDSPNTPLLPHTLSIGGIWGVYPTIWVGSSSLLKYFFRTLPSDIVYPFGFWFGDVVLVLLKLVGL